MKSLLASSLLALGLPVLGAAPFWAYPGYSGGGSTPTTAAQIAPGNLSSLGVPETDYTAADVTATDTTPVDVTGISFTLDANDVYSIACEGMAVTALASAGVQPGFDIPADASIGGGCTIVSSGTTVRTGNFSTDDGACATTDAIVSPGSQLTVNATVTMVTAGDVKLRVRSETTDDVTVKAGYRCSAKKIVDS